MEPSLEPFEAEDALLFPNLRSILDTYLDANGTLPAACEALSQSYVGQHEMIRLLINWMESYGGGAASFDKAVESVLLSHEQALVAGLEDTLTSPESQPILSGIAASPRWNPVVSAMAARHRGSMLHSMLARENRLLLAGMGQQIVKTPEGFIEALSGLVYKAFADVPSLSDKELTALYKRIAAMCTYDECSTLLALRHFSDLARLAEDRVMRGLYKRIGQEVRKEVVKVLCAGSVLSEAAARQYGMRLALVVQNSAANVRPHRNVIEALMGILTHRPNGTPFDAEIKVLMEVYGCAIIEDLGIEDDGDVDMLNGRKRYSIEEKVLLIQWLCMMEVFDGIMKALFSHKHRTYLDSRLPDVDKRRCLCLLLAYSAVFIEKEDNEIEEMLRSTNAQGKSLGSAAVRKQFGKVGLVASVCEELYPGCQSYRIKGKSVEVLLSGVQDKVLVRGVLMWAQEGLRGGCDPRALLKTAPKHLAFLQAIAQDHAVLRGEVLQSFREAFDREYTEMVVTQVEDMRELFMKRITELVRVQMGSDIVQVFLESWVDNERVDDSHVKNFVSELLSSISPPYADSFVRNVLRLLRHKRVVSSIVKDDKVSKMVISFQKNAYDLGMG